MMEFKLQDLHPAQWQQWNCSSLEQQQHQQHHHHHHHHHHQQQQLELLDSSLSPYHTMQSSMFELADCSHPDASSAASSSSSPTEQLQQQQQLLHLEDGSAAVEDAEEAEEEDECSHKAAEKKSKTPVMVAKRNARERRRVEAVNSAFSKLRKYIPYERRNKRLSKVKTLRITIDYIHLLESVLQDLDSGVTADHSDNFHNLLLLCKRKEMGVPIEKD